MMPNRFSPPSARRILPTLAWVLGVAALFSPGTLHATAQGHHELLADYLDDGALPPEAQRLLAEQFAPVLVFHPHEEYFPTSPLFPIELDGSQDGRSPADMSFTLEALGTATSRTAQYRSLTLEEQGEIATVYYRAYPALRDSRQVVVIEYWLYYVQNSYRMRGGILPFWVDGSHPNDLEHIHLVLRSTDDGLVPEKVWSSSHQGVVPANRYRYQDTDDAFRERPRFLVERGSHAMAPDVDGDGLFTPVRDGHSGYRFIWGIRDRGIAQARYSRSYLDADRETASVVLVPALDVPPDGGDLTYELRPVDEISEAFDALNLTVRERQEAFEVARHWLRRAFGGDNGSSGKLLVPPVRADGRASIGIPHISSTERGFLVGGTFKFQEQGAYLGARYGYLHGIRYLPDVIAEVNAVQTTRQGYASTQVLLSHPIDASTKFMAGGALVTDSWRFDRRQWDWYVGVEMTLGSMRISGASRSWGPITNLSKEFRLAYFF